MDGRRLASPPSTAPRSGARLPARSALAATVAALLLPAAAIARESAEPAGTLEEIVVKGQYLRAQDAPYSATTLSAAEIRDLGSVGATDRLFERVPGMAVRDLQLGGVANNIVIRGFGSGGHGGDLGAILDGIPLNEAMSHADGYVDLNVVVPLEIDALTVYKGPVSPLYGNFNRGGLVAIQTRTGGDYAEVDLAGGSFDTVDLQAAFGTALGERQQLNLAGQWYTTGGWRPQSDAERGTLAGRWSLQATPALQLALSGRRHTGDADSASYLLRRQWETDPRGIDPRVQNDGAEKDFGTLRADVNYEFGPRAKLLTYAYRTRQDFTRWFSRPVNATTWRQREETYDRTVDGLGTSLNGLFAVAAREWKYVAGVETIRESTEYQFYDALDFRQRTGPAVSDRETSLDTWSAFGELEAPLHELAQLTLGFRADRFDGGCERLGPETGTDPCGPLNDASHVSPKLGLRSQVRPSLQLRASWAEGFALANGFVKYSVGGQPLDETVFRQTELGARWTAGDTVDLDVAVYRLDSDGEVRTVSPGVFENFGATRREGIEAALTWQPLAELRLTGVYGVTTTEIVENADPRLVGRRIAGVPVNTATFDAEWAPWPAWSLTAGYRFVGSYSIDAFNALSAASHSLVDLGVAYRQEAERWPYRAYLRVDNLQDRGYATSELLLANQRAVAPGAPRAVHAGVQVNFR
jgi:outer membrane receptor protein involved in Fe transport